MLSTKNTLHKSVSREREFRGKDFAEKVSWTDFCDVVG